MKVEKHLKMMPAPSINDLGWGQRSRMDCDTTVVEVPNDRLPPSMTSHVFFLALELPAARIWVSNLSLLAFPPSDACAHCSSIHTLAGMHQETIERQLVVEWARGRSSSTRSMHTSKSK